MFALVRYRPKSFGADAKPELREPRPDQKARSREMKSPDGVKSRAELNMSSVRIELPVDRRATAAPPPCMTPRIELPVDRRATAAPPPCMTPRSDPHVIAARGGCGAEGGGGGGDEDGGALDEASACDVPMPLADPGTLTTRRAGRASVAPGRASVLRTALSSSGARSLSRELVRVRVRVRMS